MDTEPISNRCPKCQTPLPPDAPHGLCPKCLLAAVAMPTDAGQPAGRPTPPAIAEIAAAFPQLEILEFIGQGGMGFVFKARQPKLDRLVALKILPQSLAADPTFAERFNREARLLARLNHPGIVTVHDFGVAAGRAGSPLPAASEDDPERRARSDAPYPPQNPDARTQTQFYYLLMEFVDGVNLRQAMQAGRFTPEQALAIVPKICEALQFAHNEGILHRDIKPENILLDAKGRVKISDFGIAKLVGDVGQAFQPADAGDFPVARSDSAATGGENTGLESPVNRQAGKPALRPDALTEAGKALGTPNYMAPEQLENAGEVDHRADIYSLGVVFYEMLTGELPTGRFAPPSQKSAADPRVDEVVLRALEKEKTRRFASAEEVRTQVETIVTGGSERESDPSKPASLDAATTKPRFSRLAIAGAIWAGVMLLHFAKPVLIPSAWAHHWLIEILVYGSAALFWSGFIGTTVLGWLAVSQIRRSNGRSRGMGLALFDALLFPLLVFDVAVAFIMLGVLASRLAAPEVARSPIVVTSALAVSVVMDYFIVRAIWLAVSQSGTASATASSKTSRILRIALPVGLLLLLAASYLYMADRNARLTPINNARQLAIATLLYASDHTNQLPAKLDDLQPYVGKLFDLSHFTIVYAGKLDELPHPPHEAVLFYSTTPDSLGRYVIGFADGHVEWRTARNGELAPSASSYGGKPPNASFGPVVERVLPLNAQGYSSSYDLDADVMQTYPPGLKRTDSNSAITLQPGIVVAVETNGAALSVAGTATQIEPLRVVAAWENLSPGDIKVSYVVETGKTVRVACHDAPPLTFAFRTERGNAGLLQVTGFTENPRGVKIRYKLVENGNPPTASIVPTNSQSSLNQPNTNGLSRDYYLMHAWDVSYNLTTNVSSLESRWELLLTAISRLRDEGLRDYPDDVMIHRELAWLLQHRLGLRKVGGDSSLATLTGFRKDGTIEVDPDQVYLRYRWAKLMEQALQDDALLARMKLDRALMKSVEEKYGPLDWRLPETHAIYWCSKRLQMEPAPAGDDLKILQRVIWQCLQLGYQQGKLVGEPSPTKMRLEHNLALVLKVNAAYEQQIAAEEPGSSIIGNIRTGQRNFLRDAIVALHEAGRKEEACAWFEKLCKISANHPLLWDDPMSSPGKLTCEEFIRRFNLSEAQSKPRAEARSLNQQVRVISQAPFIAHLPVGEVELLGVSEFQRVTNSIYGHTHEQRAGLEKTWWQPDGSPLNQKIPYNTGGMNYKGRDFYELAFRVRGQTNGMPNVEMESLTNSRAYAWGMSGATWARRVEDVTFQKTLGCEPGLTQASFRIGVATEAWRTEDVMDFSSGSSSGREAGKILLSVTAAGEETIVTCQYEQRPGQETRLIALGPKGEIEPVRNGQTFGAGNNTSETRIFRTADIKEARLHLQRRPYHWV